MLKVNEYSKKYGISKSTIYKNIKKGLFQFYRVKPGHTLYIFEPGEKSKEEVKNSDIIDLPTGEGTLTNLDFIVKCTKYLITKELNAQNPNSMLIATHLRTLLNLVNTCLSNRIVSDEEEGEV